MDNTLPNKDLVIACLEDHPRAMVLLRIARSRAAQSGCKWRVVFVETPSQVAASDSGFQERMLKLLTLATQMGGEIAHITAESYDKAAERIIREDERRLALLITGIPEQRPLFSFRRTLSQVAAQYANKLKIPVEKAQISGQSYRYSLRERLRFFRISHIFYALCSVGVAYVCAFLLQQYLPPALFRINNQNIALLFMTACAFSAGRFGLIPGLVASGTSFFVFNYFLTQPYYHINLNSVTDQLSMMIFLSAAILISIFTSRTRGFAEKASRRELRTQVLFNLARVVADVPSRQQAIERLQEHLARTLNTEVAFFLPLTLNPDAIQPAWPSAVSLRENDVKALEICWKEMKTTGLCSPTFPSSKWRFTPMLAQNGPVGVIGVRPYKDQQMDVWLGGMLMLIADQVANAIDHIELSSAIEATRISEEREKLRSMLLSSVSHDLKTPLASIIGALNIYHSHGNKIDAQSRSSLIETALGEAERLDSFITNILDMTRLESKKIKFKCDWHDPRGIVNDVMKRLQYRLRNHKIVLHPCEHNYEVYMDYMMTGQVLQNVIDNACKYTPVGTLIEISLLPDPGVGFFFQIRDHGRGIPLEKIETIFDKYARLQMRDSQVAGTGLGLAIAKAVVDAQGGYVKADNHPEGGAVFTIYMPKWRPAAGTASKKIA